MKYKFLGAAAMACMILLLNGCKKELNVNPQERITLDNYYKTEADAFAALVAVYDRFAYQAGGLYDKAAIMDVAGDDQLAGGGGPTDINDLQVTERYTLSATTGPQGYLWNRGYAGIYRANILLSKIDGIAMDAAKKARFVAELKAMRGAFYFDLVTFFKNIPLIEGTVDPADLYNVEQTTPDKIYAYVEKDLNDAIAALPATVPVATEGGRLTKGGAQALLGKVLLYQKKWQAAADQFAVVNGTAPGVAASVYGYKLVPNFADLWKTSNKFSSEAVIEFVHSSLSNGGWGDAGASEGNLLCIITGPRGYSQLNTAAPDYFSGYSFLVFTQAFYNFIKNDPRSIPTVANLDSLKAAGLANYTPGYNNTGLFLNKFIARVSNKVATTPELNFGQDEYEIRLADTYLMEAEALLNAGAAVGAGSRAYQLLNAVRARVGLAPVAVTQTNIETERRLELAGEGQRWPDLVRWGKAATVLASKGFVAGKNELFPIPQNELNNTKLKQNPGY
ncbi:MAG: RagB/SusD family nutrient uptake outer membrane protein [Williamsia sp.]|nr:RagB/SusD family nutrient uptake outer membrane protein [Williamsia sp.]